MEDTFELNKLYLKNEASFSRSTNADGYYALIINLKITDDFQHHITYVHTYVYVYTLPTNMVIHTVVMETNDTKIRRALPSALMCLFVY